MKNGTDLPISSKTPTRGEIWFAKLSVDPPDKGLRPVVMVSIDARNRHERAPTVLVVPLTTAIHKSAPARLSLRRRNGPAIRLGGTCGRRHDASEGESRPTEGWAA